MLCEMCFNTAVQFVWKHARRRSSMKKHKICIILDPSTGEPPCCGQRVAFGANLCSSQPKSTLALSLLRCKNAFLSPWDYALWLVHHRSLVYYAISTQCNHINCRAGWEEWVARLRPGVCWALACCFKVARGPGAGSGFVALLGIEWPASSKDIENMFLHSNV